ncbi:hypothetical protein pdam_00011444, partial [Pocillopora damicornis]
CEALGKFGEHERCVGVARGVAKSNSSFLSALQTSQVLYISMNARLTCEALGKFGEHERCVGVARGVAKSNSNFLSALQTSRVLHISMNAQLTYEPIVL